MVRLERIGETVLGRPMIMAVITSERNHARLEEIRRDQARLADPRGGAAGRAGPADATQPAVAFIGASLHGNEIMATQMSMELAHDLVTDAGLRANLENVVVLLVPGMNPDGLDITRDWWLRTRQTPHAGTQMPWLYHHYVGHDNNRDFFMITQPETQAVTRVLYERWFPNVVFDVHQMGNRGARFFIPPFADPLNPNIDPLLVRMTNLVGVQMALELTAAGKTGVSHQARFDLWWHGGGRTVPARHNMVGILSEAASADYGDPITQTRRSCSSRARLHVPRTPGRAALVDAARHRGVRADQRRAGGLMTGSASDFVRNYVAGAGGRSRPAGGGPVRLRRPRRAARPRLRRRDAAGAAARRGGGARGARAVPGGRAQLPGGTRTWC
jgi:hypothetical protein